MHSRPQQTLKTIPTTLAPGRFSDKLNASPSVNITHTYLFTKTNAHFPLLTDKTISLTPLGLLSMHPALKPPTTNHDPTLSQPAPHLIVHMMCSPEEP
ncbi:hypothetical protein E2C01_003179 [Portunus trituberculatus]|uniref:Uncharacterized protein n=1 Tax=Portunus trituberculatus TaxID=210409 RepID=A0A5B7CLI3_PORTR|nr:hypothetical protein [Portunus trituberculatus]